MHMMYINEEQLIDNMLEESRLGFPRKPDSAPTFVVDAINLTRIAALTHYQRDYLENGQSTVRQHNPNSNKQRMMIPSQKHRKILKLMCNKQPHPKSGEFVSITNCVDAKSFVAYVRASRPALFKILKFMYTNENKNIQIDSSLISLHELFRHWSCRNHETTLIFPSAGHLLKPFTNRPSFTKKHYVALRKQVPGPLLSLVDYGMERMRKGKPKILPLTIRNLLKLSISLAKADTSIIGNAAAFLKRLTNTCHCPSILTFVFLRICNTVTPCDVRSRSTTRLSTFCNENLPDIVDTPALVVTWNVHVYRMHTSMISSHVYASSFFTCCPRRYTYIDTVKILDQTNVLHHTHTYITGSC